MIYVYKMVDTLQEWKERVILLHYFEACGVDCSQGWIEVWEHHPNYDANDRVSAAFNKNFKTIK